jgi:hypothetical protein
LVKLYTAARERRQITLTTSSRCLPSRTLMGNASEGMPESPSRKMGKEVDSPSQKARIRNQRLSERLISTSI